MKWCATSRSIADPPEFRLCDIAPRLQWSPERTTKPYQEGFFTGRPLGEHEMKCFANLYRDSAGRGVFGNTYDSPELARQHTTGNFDLNDVEYVCTVGIIVISDAPNISQELIKSALHNSAIDTAKNTATYTYKEKYVIHAKPYQLADTGEWVVNITIVCDRGADTRIDQYTDDEARFDTCDEAVSQCFAFGRQVIDEQMPR